MMPFYSPSGQHDPRDIFPQYSRNAYHSAAKRIRKAILNNLSLDPKDEEVIENWRASHRHILNAWQVTLRNRGNQSDVVSAQRLKRRSTIYNKLLREPQMSLIRMHDIAGCRLIFKNYDEMLDYIIRLHQSRRIKHELNREYDYITCPKETGYRGIHDEYVYRSRKASDRSNLWDGLLLEIQFRTIYQHAWATAVEVAGSITHNNTKFNQGDENQKEFFRLASEIIARTCESQKSCYPDMPDKELARLFERLEKKINLLHRLKQIKIAKDLPNWKNNNIILRFTLDTSGKPSLEETFFDSFSKANKRYFELEKERPLDDIVLVRTNDSKIGKTIRDAFRNYFSDTKDFIEYIENGLKVLKGEKVSSAFKPTKNIIEIKVQEKFSF